MAKLDKADSALPVHFEQIAGILQSINYTVVVLDEHTNVRFINEAGERLIGRSRGYVLGRPATDALPEFFGKVFLQHLLSKGVLQADKYEEHFPALDLWSDVYLCPSPFGILVTIHDISSKRRHERVLTGEHHVLEMVAQAAPLRAILDAITAVVEQQSSNDLCSILRLDEDGHQLHLAAGGSVPPEYHAAISDIEIGPAVGSCGTAAYTRHRVIVSDIAIDPLWSAFKDVALKYGLHACWSQPILSRDGKKVLGTIANYSRRSGEPTRQSLLLLAIAAHLAQVAIEADQVNAERQQTQEQLRAARDAAQKANRAKDRFLAILSHELRTPLSPALLIAASMARDASLSPEARENLSLIERSIHLQSRLINDLLDLSRIENNKLSLQLQPVDFHEVVQDCLRMCEADVTNKQISVLSDLKASRHVLAGDPLRLRQIVCNLIKNAAKFTPDGGRLIITSSNPTDESIQVSVQDSGIGATPDVIAKIFEPFEQGGRAGESQGLGLGLTICKGLAEAHGGRITATSKGPNQGMTMTLDFPVVAAKLAPAPAVVPAAAGVPQTPLRILLVEDHPDTLRTLAELLQRLRHQVVAVDSVRSALAAAESHHFDLIISDLGLPDGTGTGLMHELLKRGPLRGIALTGYGMESDIQKTREAGFFAHLTKPIDFEQLQQAIKAGSGSFSH